MFNVWLPSVLESRQPDGENAIKGALNEYVLYAVAGCPGSVVGAWMIETKLGRRKSLAVCTLATAIAVFAFIEVHAGIAATISSMLISLTGTAMYAVLCKSIWKLADNRRYDSRDLRHQYSRYSVRNISRTLSSSRCHRTCHCRCPLGGPAHTSPHHHHCCICSYRIPGFGSAQGQ